MGVAVTSAGLDSDTGWVGVATAVEPADEGVCTAVLFPADAVTADPATMLSSCTCCEPFPLLITRVKVLTPKNTPISMIRIPSIRQMYLRLSDNHSLKESK